MTTGLSPRPASSSATATGCRSLAGALAFDCASPGDDRCKARRGRPASQCRRRRSRSGGVSPSPVCSIAQQRHSSGSRELRNDSQLAPVPPVGFAATSSLLRGIGRTSVTRTFRPPLVSRTKGQTRSSYRPQTTCHAAIAWREADSDCFRLMPIGSHKFRRNSRRQPATACDSLRKRRVRVDDQQKTHCWKARSRKVEW